MSLFSLDGISADEARWRLGWKRWEGVDRVSICAQEERPNAKKVVEDGE